MSRYAPTNTCRREDEDVDQYDDYDLRGPERSHNESGALQPYRSSAKPRSQTTTTSLIRRPRHDESPPPSRPTRSARPACSARDDDAEEGELDDFMDSLGLDDPPRRERKQAPSRRPARDYSPSPPRREREQPTIRRHQTREASPPPRAQRPRPVYDEGANDSPPVRSRQRSPSCEEDSAPPTPRERRRRPGLLYRRPGRTLHADTGGFCDCGYSYEDEGEAQYIAQHAGMMVYYCTGTGKYGIEPR